MLDGCKINSVLYFHSIAHISSGLNRGSRKIPKSPSLWLQPTSLSHGGCTRAPLHRSTQALHFFLSLPAAHWPTLPGPAPPPASWQQGIMSPGAQWHRQALVKPTHAAAHQPFTQKDKQVHIQMWGTATWKCKRKGEHTQCYERAVAFRMTN